MTQKPAHTPDQALDQRFLDDVGAVGGFFALRSGEPPRQPETVPFARVYAGLRDGSDALRFRVEKVAARLGAPEARIAVSVAQLGLAARLWSVALGCAAVHGAVPDLDPDRLRWAADGTSPDDLWLTGATATHTPASATLRAVVQDAHLAPLHDALRARYRVSARLLWGNAGSALAGAVRELDAWARRVDRPDVAERARALAAELFAHADLRGTGTLTGTSFRRRSCCLYYRCPNGGVCGDCCFGDRPPRRPLRHPSAPGASG